MPHLRPQPVPEVRHEVTTEPPRIELTTKFSKDMVELMCGRQSRGFDRQGRVVGGQRALSRKQWPWLAAVFQFDGQKYKLKCGAVLLNENWVLSAAHCIHKTDLPDLEVKFGSDDIHEDMTEFTVKRNVSRIVVHPEFNAFTFANDIVLLRLSEPIKFASNLLPICLPRPNLSNVSFEGAKATLIGWGRVAEEGPMARILRFVNMTVISNSKCAAEYTKAGFTDKIGDEFICTYDGDTIRKDACEGDSGGPLVIPVDGQYTLIGTVSWGIGSNCARPHQPTVYTRITRYLNWIAHSLD
jgi:secreted trypsin-like serine protease